MWVLKKLHRENRLDRNVAAGCNELLWCDVLYACFNVVVLYTPSREPCFQGSWNRTRTSQLEQKEDC